MNPRSSENHEDSGLWFLFDERVHYEGRLLNNWSAADHQLTLRSAGPPFFISRDRQTENEFLLLHGEGVVSWRIVWMQNPRFLLP